MSLKLCLFLGANICSGSSNGDSCESSDTCGCGAGLCGLLSSGGSLGGSLIACIEGLDLCLQGIKEIAKLAAVANLSLKVVDSAVNVCLGNSDTLEKILNEVNKTGNNGLDVVPLSVAGLNELNDSVENVLNGEVNIVLGGSGIAMSARSNMLVILSFDSELSAALGANIVVLGAGNAAGCYGSSSSGGSSSGGLCKRHSGHGECKNECKNNCKCLFHLNHSFRFLLQEQQLLTYITTGEAVCQHLLR